MLNRILIDPQVLINQESTLEGKVLLAELDSRVLLDDIADASEPLSYRFSGGTDSWQRPFLDLSLTGSLQLKCQRCLKSLEFTLKEQAHIVLFDDEATLDHAMLEEEELEGILNSHELDLSSLIEDQILMAMPFAPMHQTCDDSNLLDFNQDKPNPFAVLAGLKKSG